MYSSLSVPLLRWRCTIRCKFVSAIVSSLKDQKWLGVFEKRILGQGCKLQAKCG